MKKATFLHKQLTALLLVTTLAFAGCAGIGNDVVDEAPPDATGTVNPDVEHIVNPDTELFDGETLTVAVISKALAQPFAARYMRENPGVTIELVSFEEELERDGNYLDVQKQIGIQLMAGRGPVLIQQGIADSFDPRSAQYFYDWFPVMNADPEFNEDDWFMNAFHAVSMNGRLLSFPTYIYYNMATANCTIPGLAKALAAYECITISELVELHRAFSANTQYYFEPRSSLDILLVYDSYKFFDFETGWVDFNNSYFIDFISKHKDLWNQDSTFYGNSVVSPAEEIALSDSYSFYFTEPYQHQYFLGFEESLFTEITPVVNDDMEDRKSVV